MIEETPHHRGTTLVRRMLLEPGEATRWHVDPFHRMSVVLKGNALAIEIRVSPGQVDWDEPRRHVHRAVNIGNMSYEEISVFFLGHPNDVPHPDVPE